MNIVKLLQDKNYELSFHDPYVKQEQVLFPLSSFEEAIKGTECILVLADHKQFKNLDEATILTSTKRPAIFDTRNCVDVKSDGIIYYNFNNLHEMKNFQIETARI
jgi:UDP-N-acetyl-D-mannosaminuronic acid dehydrogenase